MPASNHRRPLLARLALAGGGLAVFTVVALAAHAAAGLIGGARGMAAGVFVCAAAFGCGLALHHRARVPSLTRPAPVRLPEPAGDDLEPVNSLT